MKKSLRILTMTLVLLLSVSILTACGGGEEGPTSEPGEKEKKTEEEEQKTEFSQDEVITYKGVDYTVDAVERHMGDEFDTPKEGCEYVTVSISIVNNSDEKISYNPYDWKMENSNGQETETAFYVDDYELSSGDLNPGGNVSGNLTFEEPQGDAGLKLNYYDNALFDDEATFKVVIE